MVQYIDLSVAIEHQLPVDPPVQRARIEYMDHDASVDGMLAFFPGVQKRDLPDGKGWAVETITLSTHTGTHVDAPYHYHPTMNGTERAWTIDEVPLDWFFGNGVLVDFSDRPDGYVCTPQDFIDYFEKIHYQLKPNDIVLVRTSAMRYWGSEQYFHAGCGIGREATLWLIDQGVHLTGTDAWSWDTPLSKEAEQFSRTKDAGIIWEGHKAGRVKAYCHIEKLANLDRLPPYGFRVVALPVKIHRASAGWTRVVAILDGENR